MTYGYNGSGQLTTLTRGAGTTDALTTTFGYSGTQLKRHGQAREMGVEALANMRHSQAVDVLCALLADEEIAGRALVALGKLKVARARPQIEPFLNHSEGWVRKEAKRALAKIDKAKK